MTNDTETPAPPPADWAQRLLAFWFDAHGMDDWYGGGPAFDAEVRELAEGWHEAWPDERRQFACLPFQHSEDIGDQRESLRLFGGFDDPMFQDYAQKHFDIVDRFGRFPHRNEALGRATRADEEAAIEEGRNW